jgi:hypothetical protein
MPDAKHPVWKIARLAIVCTTLLLFFAFGYSSPIESKDVMTIIGTLLALGGFDISKAIATSAKAE